MVAMDDVMTGEVVTVEDPPAGSTASTSPGNYLTSSTASNSPRPPGSTASTSPHVRIVRPAWAPANLQPARGPLQRALAPLSVPAAAVSTRTPRPSPCTCSPCTLVPLVP